MPKLLSHAAGNWRWGNDKDAITALNQFTFYMYKKMYVLVVKKSNKMYRTNTIRKPSKSSLIPFFNNVSTMSLSHFMKESMPGIKSPPKPIEQDEFTRSRLGAKSCELN